MQEGLQLAIIPNYVREKKRAHLRMFLMIHSAEMRTLKIAIQLSGCMDEKEGGGTKRNSLICESESMRD